MAGLITSSTIVTKLTRMQPTFGTTRLGPRPHTTSVIHANLAASKVSQAAAKVGGVLSSAVLTASLLLGPVDAAALSAAPLSQPALVQQHAGRTPLAFLGFGEDKSIKLPDGTKVPLDQLPPGIDAKAVREAVKVLEKNPEAAQQALQQAKQLTEVFSDPKVQQKFGKLAEDPELKSFFNDIRAKGPGALQQYYNDPAFLSKLSSKLTDAGLGPEVFQNIKGSAGASSAVNSLADAAKAGDIGALKKFIAKGSVDARDDKGVTALGLAVGFDQVSAIKELLKAGADPNATDKKGNTPLHYAAAYGRKEAAKVLLDAGAKPNIKNKEGKTPADGAHLNKKDDLLPLLASARV